MSKNKYLILALTIVAFAVPIAVSAQSSDKGSGFQISPVREELVLEPGESSEKMLTIKNTSGGKISANVVVNDFEASVDESGNPRIIFDTDQQAPGNSLRKLIGDLGSVSLEPGEETQITVPISIPNDATAGGYYGIVRLDPDASGDGVVNLNASVGTIFLVTVPGDLKESLELVEITAAKAGSTGRFFIDGAEDIQVITRLKNNGTIHTKPFGKIQITNSKGEVVEQYEFNNTEPRSNVLPDSVRKFTDEIEYKDFFGKYTITANLGYGNGNGLITAKNTFWVVPIWIVIVAVVAILALIAGAFLIYRKLSKNNKHKVKPRR